MDKIYVALGTNVFVKEIEIENKVGDWVIPDSLESDFTYGEVISCGEYYFENGQCIQSPVRNGDVVVFAKISGSKITLNNMKLIRVQVRDIIAKQVDGKIEE